MDSLCDRGTSWLHEGYGECSDKELFANLRHDLGDDYCWLILFHPVLCNPYLASFQQSYIQRDQESQPDSLSHIVKRDLTA